jgi:alpha-galactosidase
MVLFFSTKKQDVTMKLKYLLVTLILLSTLAMAQAQQIAFDPAAIEITGELGDFKVELSPDEISPGLYIINVKLSSETAATPPQFSLKWTIPSVDIAATWTPQITLDKATYYKRFTSRAANYAPVISHYSNSDRNRHTFACSDGLRSIGMQTYIREEDSLFYNFVRFFSEKSPAITHYEAQLRVDLRPVSMVKSLADTADWWASQTNYTPAEVPAAARRPMYSTWYSFHQNITADEVVEQSALARKLGFEAVIVDDGWQTLDSQRGYAFCGDWEPVRIGDMKDFVERIHALDMKFLLWYSVSLVGENSEAHKRLDGKYLRYWDGQGSYVLDPRFPEVREYIINTYEKALVDWRLDGFKLDFIGMFRPDDKTVFEAIDGRDFASIDEAVDRLMTDIMARLKAIKTDIMIEFRQPYVGPLMRKYGNMFRATDCPNMAMVNRVRTTDVRLIAGNTAVHSDMFMWHMTDTVESAALQILNILFSVPQLSVKLNDIPEDHQKMVTFWIDYWNKNQTVLLDSEFLPMNPSAGYPLIMGRSAEKAIYAIYNKMIVTIDAKRSKIDLINASGAGKVAIDLLQPLGAATIAIFDCQGNEMTSFEANLKAGTTTFEVPKSGLLQIKLKK